tara:strand:+ start:473 stop:658 length:186 start_codon:yes stop_codon:yes gene_type:complete
MKNKINVNQENSKMLGGKLYITGLKMSRLGAKLGESIVKGNTLVHPSMGLMYEYSGSYNRK